VEQQTAAKKRLKEQQSKDSFKYFCGFVVLLLVLGLVDRAFFDGFYFQQAQEAARLFFQHAQEAAEQARRQAMKRWWQAKEQWW
jgi:hypothetical protein